MSRTMATGTGFLAVLLWASLAILTVLSNPVPPFQLAAMTFALGAALGFAWGVARGSLGELRIVPPHVYILGSLGLFGYHALYFFALRLAPPAEAGLIAYLWPLLIVLFSGLLPTETLRRGHIIGASLGFAGAAVLVWGGVGRGGWSAWPGYALALLGAITWAAYSVGSRRFGAVPTISVAVFCAITSALSVIAHFIFEVTITPELTAWLAIVALGLGPVGAAFFFWDIGVKHGDIQVLGVLSYAAPVLSTGVLVVFGVSPATLGLVIATILITGGAALAARSSLSAANAVER